MSQLRLSLLGPFDARIDGTPLVVSRNKAKALLAYLAMPAGKVRSRDEVCALLWGRTGEAQARGSLRQALFAIRGSLPADLGPVAVGDDLSLEPERILCDASDFEIATAGGSIANHEKAIELYRGAFLQGFTLREHGFDCWVSSERARLDNAALSSMAKLLKHYLGVCRHDDAINVAHKALAIDPLHEGAHRALIVSYGATGRLGLAHAQYEECRELLERELGVTPEAETRRAYHEVSGGRQSSQNGNHRPEQPATTQQIRFCRAFDGIRIAYATVGDGPPLIKAPNWMTHLEYEWQSPVWRHYLRELSRDHTFIRFDQRGNGLSDRDIDDISFDAFVSDLEAVADRLELDRFPLLGISQGCAISIAYAARHPERVSKLVLCGGFIRGAAKRDGDSREKSDAVDTLIRLDWGKDRSGLRAMYTSNLIPGGTKEQLDWYTELMRVSATPENASRLRLAMSLMDVSELLPLVRAPTLVLHARNDAVAPFQEGQALADGIPGARFVPLDSDNHILLEHEAAWPGFVREVRAFLNDV